MNTKPRNNSTLPIVILVTIVGLIYALSSLLSPAPEIIIPIGLIIGIFMFQLSFSLPISNYRWVDFRLLLIFISSSTIGVLLLLMGCTFVTKDICYGQSISTQIVFIYVLPLAVCFIVWLFDRLPVIIGIKQE